MSADDFQTKYASVMESMLKSAVAETTKLFETMVDELKAEISSIKKENEDLKTRCRQFENAKIQTAADTREGECLGGTSDGFEKRDTAVQCELVPVRAMMVEQCQPIREPSLQNQARQCYEEREYGFQEHNYVTQRQGDCQMAHVQVKQEDGGGDDDSSMQPILKQEYDEPTVSCSQVEIDKSGLPRNSTCEMENEESHINQQCSTGQMPFPQKNKEIPKTQDLFCSGMDLQGIQNQFPVPEHSLVISLAALKDDLEEECEIGVNASEIGNQTTSHTHLDFSQHKSVELLENQQQRAGDISLSEQSDVTQQEYGNEHCAVEQLAEPTQQNKDTANEELNAGIEEDEASFQPLHRKRGRPPKRAQHLQQLVIKDFCSSSTDVSNKEGMVTTLHGVKKVKVSSTNTGNTTASGSAKPSPLKSKGDSGNTKKPSVPILMLPLGKRRSSGKKNPAKSQQLFTEKEKTSNPAPSNEKSAAAQILNTTPAGSPHPRKRCTSATYQDAMLLVEAMNQSTVKDPQTQCTQFVNILAPVDEMPAKPQKSLLPAIAQDVAGKLPVTEGSTSLHSTVETPKVASQIRDAAPNKKDQTHPVNQQHVMTLSSSTAVSAPFSSGVIQTSVRSSPIKQSNIATQKIIVVPRPTSISKSHQIATLSPSQLPAVVSTVVTAQNTGLPPGSTASRGGGSVVQKTIYVTSREMRPVVPSQSSINPREQQSGSSAPPKITIIIPRPSQTVLLAKMKDSAKLQDSTKPQSPDTAATSQLSSSSQDSRVSVGGQITSDEASQSLSQKKDKIPDNLESHKQAMCDPESTNAPKDTCNPVKESVEQVPGSVCPVVKPLVQPKLTAMVRLTRLPLQVSTKESFFVSRLLSNGSSRAQSILIHSSTPNKPSSMIIINQPAAKPVLSTNKCASLKEIANDPPMSEEPSSVEEKVLPFSETSTLLEESQESGYMQPSTSYTVSVATTREEIIGNAVQNEMGTWSTAPVHVTALTPKDTSDPHLKMTKTQFLAKLAVSPIDDAPEKASTEVADAKSCGAERSQTNSVLSRLRSHLKPHLQARRAEPEQRTETEASDVSPKKLRLETCGPNDKNTNKPVTISPSNQVMAEDVMATNNDATPITPSRPELCKDDVRARKSVIELNTVSSQRLNVCSESTLVSSGKQIVGPKNKQTRSISPRRSSPAKNDATKSKHVSPKRTDTSRNNTSPKNTKSTCVSPKRTETSRNGSSPKNTKSTCVSPKKTKTGGNLSGSPRMERRSTFTKISSKRIKRESSSFSPGRCVLPTDGTVGKKAKRESASSRVGLDKGGVGPERTGESAPAKKTRSDYRDSEKKLKVANAKKLAKAAKAKKMAKIRMSKKLQKLQDGDKTSRLAENKSNCETLRKCTTKAIWVPPRMPVPKTPKKDNKSLQHSSVVSFRSIPSPPIVSPLQPLSVIGGRLLKNQCGECGRVLSSRAALESHVALHIGRRPFSCTLCGKSFPDSKGLKRHGRVHRNGRIHVCQQCGKGFVYRFGLSKHLQMVHGRIKPFVCQICNKGFYAKRDVESHIRIHTGEKPFQCNLCDKKFTRRVELNVHLRWHNGEKRHWCPFCGKGFLDFNNLKRHKYIHTGEKPHSCPYCSKNFTQSGHLKKHVKNVHKAE